jgi:hypothetical protein
MNAEVCSALDKSFSVNYAGPVNPPIHVLPRAVTFIRRSMGLGESFHTFSARRLKEIASAVSTLIDDSADADFFHGATPWIGYSPGRPYFAFVDVSFGSYVSLYHAGRRFIKSDIDRIRAHEADWLGQAI